MEYRYETFTVGEVNPYLIGVTPGCQIDDTGFSMYIGYENPTNEEIKAFREGRFEVTFCTIKDVIVFSFKAGNLNWQELIYTPHLSPALTHLWNDMPEENGLALRVMLFDSRTGEVKALRVMFLGHRFSIRLSKEIEEILQKPFSIMSHRQTAEDIFNRYSSNRLVKMKIDRCSFD